MGISQKAGKPAERDKLVNIPRLISDYYTIKPDPDIPAQLVSFGTSGHRGCSSEGSFNEDHILAITQALCDYRRSQHLNGPLFLGMDTHALSESAQRTALEVFAANKVNVFIHAENGFTPTPVISHAILTYNSSHPEVPSDGVVITPSHNPPEDGGFKYNPPTGGPADTGTTRVIEERANQLLENRLKKVKRIPFNRAMRSSYIKSADFIIPYLDDLKNIIDMDAVSGSGLKIGVDPMGGSGIAFWEPMADMYKLDLTVVNKQVDPTFGFMTYDRDGKIRMDCSSPYAMAGLIGMKDKFDIAFGNDPDYDRHGIVTRTDGLMNPNHFLAVAIWYLFQNRPEWPAGAMIGKTLVSSSMIDRIASYLNQPLAEVPVGFKWFVDGLLNSTYGFGGEESAGASFLRKNGIVWTTDKDGFIMDLLAAEISTRTGRNPSEHYQELTTRFGNPVYERHDAPAGKAQKEALKSLASEKVKTDSLAGEKILHKITRAPANNAPIGGLKVVTENGWFAARPSGTEDIYKIYAESFKNARHLQQIFEEAQEIVNSVI
jgi:phosphoglucomutase